MIIVPGLVSSSVSGRSSTSVVGVPDIFCSFRGSMKEWKPCRVLDVSGIVDCGSCGVEYVHGNGYSRVSLSPFQGAVGLLWE